VTSGSAALHDLKITYLAPERLRPAANNARTQSKNQLQQIAKSIARFGFVNPVLISDDFQIIAGHGRVEAAKRLGLKQVPTVRLSNLSPAERRAYVIADNRLAQLAGWDRDVLAIELQGLIDLRFDDVEVTGFSLPEIDVILEQPRENREDAEDEDSASSNGAVSRAGDLWVLGSHRLLCGDGDALDCDVIIRRWQRYTGKAAWLEGANLIFKDVETMRRAAFTTSTVSKG
jgi:ParB-like chromosome segregation protein Spo0J